ncbi:uncharacterized protein LOC111115750 [Crassostrea virginica]
MQSQQTDSKIICVEKSALERPLIEYLKGRFVRDIFLSSPDTELKNKVMSIQRRLNLKEDFAVIFRVCLKYICQPEDDRLQRTGESKDCLCETRCWQPSLARVPTENLWKIHKRC